MYGWSASVCVRRNAAASEFIWCIVYTHSSVCVRRSAAASDRVHMVNIHTHQCVFVEVQHIEIEFTLCIHPHQCHRQNLFYSWLIMKYQ